MKLLNIECRIEWNNGYRWSLVQFIALHNTRNAKSNNCLASLIQAAAGWQVAVQTSAAQLANTCLKLSEQIKSPSSRLISVHWDWRTLRIASSWSPWSKPSLNLCRNSESRSTRTRLGCCSGGAQEWRELRVQRDRQPWCWFSRQLCSTSWSSVGSVSRRRSTALLFLTGTTRQYLSKAGWRALSRGSGCRCDSCRCLLHGEGCWCQLRGWISYLAPQGTKQTQQYLSRFCHSGSWFTHDTVVLVTGAA